MNIVCWSATLAVVALMSVGCGDPSRPVEPASTLTQPAFSNPSADKAERNRAIRVDMLDKCDRATFDAAIGPGTCIRPHGITFARFIALLTAHQSAPAWRNAPWRNPSHRPLSSCP